MKHTQYTPGPWELSESQYSEGFGNYLRVGQFKDSGDIVASVCIRHKLNHTLDACGNANASLIAAAPELLEALVAMVNSFHAVEYMEPHTQASAVMARMQASAVMAHAAIIKATRAQP